MCVQLFSTADRAARYDRTAGAHARPLLLHYIIFSYTRAEFNLF